MILPTNILPLYEKLDTNAFGETLRALTWDQSDGEYGCYSTFHLHEYVQEMSDQTREEFWRDVAQCAVEEDIQEYLSMGKGGRIQTLDGHIDYAYFWDGDGTIVYRVFNDANELVTKIRNDDCKKPYRWVKDNDPIYWATSW